MKVSKNGNVLAVLCTLFILLIGVAFVTQKVREIKEEKEIKTAAQDFVKSTIARGIVTTGQNEIVAKCRNGACEGRDYEVNVWVAYDHDHTITFPKGVFIGGGLAPILANDIAKPTPTTTAGANNQPR